ncbi:MAG TPA: nucleotidyl transferase AbiEii/AbiGii toxin family protein [Chlamydiales bacterium]|nr:nucleotidyl transferase AbiEii/AbiGii toxin family protein [Chlamydiales bacterium]
MSTIRIIKSMTNRQKSVELFHLLFLRHMNERLEKGLYAIKGGCNLRFFFKSIRYSEDLDIDVKTIAKETLRNKIHKILESPNFQQTLSARGMEIVKCSEAKQTDTTQRWKLSIKLVDSPLPLPTKIEFSRRSLDDGACRFEPIDPELIHHHQIYPILANHYTQEAAICQKVDALIHRTEVQARDVFDIQLLLNAGVQFQFLPNTLREKIDIAIENTLSIEFSEFKARVVVYLMDEYQDYYNSPQIWTDIQTKVISTLEQAKLP